jgi:signal transduction histidine kinase
MMTVERTELSEVKSALSRVADILSAPLDPDPMLAQLLAVAIDLMGAERGAILLKDAGSSDLYLRVVNGFETETLQWDELGDSRAAIETVIENGQGVVEAGSQPLPCAMMCAPLRACGQVIGAVYVDHCGQADAFDQGDLEILDIFASHAAMVVENDRIQDALEREVRAKEKFVSVVSHELRIPMTSIRGYTDLLRQGVVGPVNEQQINFLDVIGNNVERMSTLITDLSDLSKLEAGKLKIECISISLSARVEEALHNWRDKIEEKKQTLEVELAPDMPQIYADPNRAMQIIINLIKNAWLYTPEGGTIRIQSYQQNGFLRLEVCDNGIGISLEDQELIFTRFFRSEDAAVREHQGWGLGLTVTKRLVELMGGAINFESELGQGSTFWVTLPVTEEACIE